MPVTLVLNGIVFDQIMPDNTGGPVLDSDLDGKATQEDEFVSFQNISSSEVDISGWQVWSVSGGANAPDKAQSGLVHEFASGTILDPGERLWVISEITGSLDWADEASEGGVEAEGGGTNLLTEGNSGSAAESVALVNPISGQYIVFNMSSEKADYSGFIPEGFPGTKELGQIDGDSVQADPGGGFSYQYNASTDSYVYDLAWIPCFAEGTLIETPEGTKPVETLKAGDLVKTLDKGVQPIIWTRRRFVDFIEADSLGQLPIEFKPGSLGPKCPRRSLVVSPQHRMLFHDRQGDEVLVPAKALLGRELVRQQRGKKSIWYHHILLDHHAIVFAEGAATESLFVSDDMLRHIGGRSRDTVLRHYPKDAPLPNPARRAISRREVVETPVAQLRAWAWSASALSTT